MDNLDAFTEGVMRDISLEITDLLMSKGMPPALATGLLASTLAVYCKTQGADSAPSNQQIHKYHSWYLQPSQHTLT